jgi:uncharacterized protein (DUF1015 family)
VADVRPFRAYRPSRAEAPLVAAPPYDVLDAEEARRLAAGNELSYLHVTKAEIDLPPDADPHAPEVYAAGARALRRLIERGHLRPDAQPCYYVYQQTMAGRAQAGLVGAASVAEYERELIKKHELTRRDKEDDRVRHIDACNGNTEPVFLTYRAAAPLDELIARAQAGTPACDFVAADGIGHALWIIDDPAQIEAVRAAFAAAPALYVADGHHRSAAAARVAALRRARVASRPGEAPADFFLATIFPHSQLRILDYNRVVKDLAGLTAEQFVARLRDKFEVVENAAPRPEQPRQIGLYLAGTWRRLIAKPRSFPADDPVRSLDVQILSDNVLAPLLGIADLRTDQRIAFVGGARGLGELERLVDDGRAAAAFAMHPTTVEQLMAIADAGQIMPPKSTWFEPKLRSGLFVRLFED